MPQLTAPGGILAVADQNQQTGARAHILLATSIETGATWTYTEPLDDGSAGQPAAVTAGTAPRANQSDGDVYAAVSH